MSKNRSVNFRVNYVVETVFNQKEQRYVEIAIQGISDEQFEKAKVIEMQELLKNTYFQKQLLHQFEMNNHFVIPTDWEKGIFTSKKDIPFLFKTEIEITSIVFEENYEERLRHQDEVLKNILKF